MTKWNRVNDGSDRAPRLAVQQAWWAMSGLGENGREWSVEEKVEKIAEAGFTGIVVCNGAWTSSLCHYMARGYGA
jgi:hypothetical protein